MQFELGDKTFIYQPKLDMGNFYGIQKPILQDTLSYSGKMLIFYSALTNEVENEEALSYLYKDSIVLYGKNPTFEFLINIFVKVYSNLDICKLLLKEFKNSLKKKVRKMKLLMRNFRNLKIYFKKYVKNQKIK